jgi:hypothetical protein
LAGDLKSTPAVGRGLFQERLCRVLHFCLFAYVLLLVVPRAHSLRNILLAVAAASALLLERLSPVPGGPQRWRRAFIAAAGIFVAVNLASCAAALLTTPAESAFEYRSLHIDGVLLALAFGLGVREARTAWRLLAALLVAAGVWYLLEVATLHLRGGGGLPSPLGSRMGCRSS